MHKKKIFGSFVNGVGALLQFGGIIGILTSREWPIIILMMLVSGVGTFLYILGKKMSQLSAQELLKRDRRAPVLLLRSFIRDDISQTEYNRMQLRDYFGVEPGLKYIGRELKNRKCFEELLGEEVKVLGPFVAIGRPGEKLPAIGASRIYETEYTWKERVREFAEKSSAIIVILDNTPGLMWEISHLADVRIRSKTLLISVTTPDKARQRTVFREWEELIAKHAGISIRLDENVVGIYFDQLGHPIVIHSDAHDVADRIAEIRRFIDYRKENACDSTQTAIRQDQIQQDPGNVPKETFPAPKAEAAVSCDNDKQTDFPKSANRLRGKRLFVLCLILAVFTVLAIIWNVVIFQADSPEVAYRQTEAIERFDSPLTKPFAEDVSEEPVKADVAPTSEEADQQQEQLIFLQNMSHEELMRRVERSDPRMNDPAYRAAFERGLRDGMRAMQRDE